MKNIISQILMVLDFLNLSITIKIVNIVDNITNAIITLENRIG